MRVGSVPAAAKRMPAAVTNVTVNAAAASVWAVPNASKNGLVRRDETKRTTP